MMESDDQLHPPSPTMALEPAEEQRKNLTLLNVRVFHVHVWDWNRNYCEIRFSSDDQTIDLSQTFCGPLPPFATPCVLYKNVAIMNDTVTDWLVEPCVFDYSTKRAFLALQNAPKDRITLLRTHFDMKRSEISALLATGAAKDHQILDYMDPSSRGVFDGLCLAEHERQILINNYKCFGRFFERSLKPPHMVVLPDDNDPYQTPNFTRSTIPELKKLSVASLAWCAIRAAAGSGVTITADDVLESYGADVFDTLKHKLPLQVPPLPAYTRVETPLVAALSIQNLHVYDDQPMPLDALPSIIIENRNIVWFTPNAGLAETISNHGVPALGIHERFGLKFALEQTETHYILEDGTAATKNGFRRLLHVPLAEGGDILFKVHSLEKIGFYAVTEFDWTPALVRRVLVLAQAQCVFYTNSNIFKMSVNSLT